MNKGLLYLFIVTTQQDALTQYKYNDPLRPGFTMRICLPSAAPTQLGKLAWLLKPSAVDVHFSSLGVGMHLLLIASQTAIQIVHTVLLAVDLPIL
jgi:hypothetical protein